MYLNTSGRIPFSIRDIFQDYILTILLIGIYIVFFSSLSCKIFEKTAIVIFKLLILTGLCFWFSSIFTGSSVGVDVSFSIPRLQCLVTEPSNIAHFLPGFLIFCWIQRWWYWCVICLTAILCTFSPTVYLTMALTILLLTLLRARPLIQLIVSMAGAIIVVLIIRSYNNLILDLSEAGQLGQAVARILEGFNFLATGGQSGANSRASLIFAGLDFLNTHKLLWTGAGFASSAFIGYAFNDGLLFDLNIWSSFLLWFGIVTIPIVSFLLYIVIRKPEKTLIYSLLVSQCVSNSLNAGGIWFQLFFATLICLRLQQKRFKKKS